MTERAADLLVVGGGIVGCAVALRAARAGLRVTVLERGAPLEEATRAAAGMLSPMAEADGPGPLLALLRRGRALFPALAEELGAGIGYDATGTLYASLRPEDDAPLEARHAWQRAAGLEVEHLTAEEARRREPALSSAVRFALRFPGDHQVDALRLGTALREAALRAGARLRTGAAVARVRVEDGRAAGVALADGEAVRAGAVVVAAGAWSGGIGGVPRALPLEPVHGQILAVRAEATPFRHVVKSRRIYLVPRAEGRVLAGATGERVGFAKAVTAGGIAALLGGMLELAPALAAAPLAETWSGLRPGTPDGLPILGADPDVAGLVYATGHFRNGILLAPITAALVVDVVLGRAPEVDLSPFSPARFGAPAAPDPSA